MSWGGCSQGQQHLSARGDSVGRELCLPKVGHTVNSSNIVGRAKNTNGAEHFPSSCQGPWPRWLGLWPAEGHQGCCGQQRVTRSLTRAAGARLHEEQGMEKPLWGYRCRSYRTKCLFAEGVQIIASHLAGGPLVLAQTLL